MYIDKNIKIAKIIYWYDKNIKMYTFQILDINDEDIEPCYYSSKNNLIATKKYYYKTYGIKPIKN